MEMVCWGWNSLRYCFANQSPFYFTKKNIALFSFNLCISTVSVCSIRDYYIFLSLPDLNMTVK